MENVRIREIAPGDVPEAVDVYFTARTEMQRRMGASPGPISDDERATYTRGYRHVTQTGIFRVAEVDGRVAGICLAVVRDQLWFLSGFWVLPEYQQMGIGGPLLREVWNAGVARGAKTQFVWASSTPTALATYLKQGMVPGHQIFLFGGPVTTPSAAPAGYEEDLLPLSTVVAIDERVRGTGREVDHLFWQTEPGREGTLVTRDNKPVGYFYHRGGAVGPVAWLDPADAEAVLALAIRQAAARAPEIRLCVAGSAPDAIRIALGAGLKLTGFSHFLTTAPFGQADRYLPSGPLIY